MNSNAFLFFLTYHLYIQNYQKVYIHLLEYILFLLYYFDFAAFHHLITCLQDLVHFFHPILLDLIYFPLTNGLFEIKFVEDEDPFYQLSGLTTFKLSVETFEYGNEALDTGIEAIDSFETQYATQTTLTLGAGTGAFVVGEDVSQTIGSVTVTGEVSSIDENFESGTKKINISSQKASDASNTLFTVTAGSAGNIIGTKNSPVANYEITSIDGFNSLDDNDPYADNSDFETIGNNFIDFTESNPFGDVNITSQ